ncbi:hypothetical protein ACQPXH_02020 [Nocardia sp. CA-135953]|uniref:hypothetical protein n=1 Tax=Nocardia sp. CA-135953 TaxID=3239978 RepID=UPI003D964FE0
MNSSVNVPDTGFELSHDEARAMAANAFQSDMVHCGHGKARDRGSAALAVFSGQGFEEGDGHQQ